MQIKRIDLIVKIKRLYIIIFIIAFTICLVNKSVNAEAVVITAEEYVEPAQEFRAVWISHYISDIPNYTTEEEYKKIIINALDKLQGLNINTILFHMRTHNNALYESKLNPLASYYQKVNFYSFDPIAWMIEECHNRGMEFHAWLNPYRVGSLNNTTLDSIVDSYKDYPNNPASNINNLLYNDSTVILNPAIPEVRDFICDSIKEIVEKYDVDGIHFDDYFYISGIDDSASLAKYNTLGLSKNDFRREQVDILIENIYKLIKNYNINNNKAVQFGISPSVAYRFIDYVYDKEPVYDEFGNLVAPIGCYSKLLSLGHYDGSTLCNTKKWIENGWLDYILPQIYGSYGYENYDFENVANWWSLTTKYKKTNLYIGIGSVSAFTLKKGWTSGKDLAKQLSYFYLNKGILGTSYFNYQSLIKDSELMNEFRQINNDYYQTKVPSAEIKTLDHVPSKLITNLKYNDGSLSWDKVDNTRGYIVWKVPQGELLDTTKAKYVLSYQTNNTYNLTLDNNYCYYVSSVNKANKISNPVSLNDYNTVENVISYINGIKNFMEYNDEYVNYVASTYETYLSLSESDKKLITNANEFESAIIRINKHNLMDNVFDEYLDSFAKHLNNELNIETIYNGYEFVWDENDYIDLENNKKLISSFGPYEVQIGVTVSNGVDLIKRIVTLNLGELDNNGRYLFYRNASGSMIITDPQEYDGSYIGWDNYIMLLDNYCLFLAKGNYLKITSSTVLTYTYPSCGVVYQNITDSPITLNVSGIPNNGDYGFLLVNANNLVSQAKSKLSEVNEITIEAGGMLYIAKYLDYKIENSPFYSISDSYVGKYLNVLKYDDYKEANVIENDIIKVLNSSSLDEVKTVYDKYQTLSEDHQVLVFSRTKLIDYYNKMVLEKEYLDLKKTEALNILNEVNMENYSLEDQTIIKELVKAYKLDIDEANDVEYINNIKNKFIDELNNILTAIEEVNLEKKISEGLNILDSYKCTFKTDKAINEFNDLLEKSKLLINNAENIDEVENLLNEFSEKAKAIVDSVEPNNPENPQNPIESIENVKKRGCKFFSSIINVFFIIGLIIIIIRKKH